jgi:hypothetical protein
LRAGRSLTQEISWRLEQSYTWEEAFGEAKGYLAGKLAEIDEMAWRHMGNGKRLAQQHELGSGFVDASVSQANASLTIDDVRSVISETVHTVVNEILDAREAQKTRKRRAA